MKRFIVSVLCTAVFFIGLAALVDDVKAGFKSDEKAVALVKQARLAIGGDQAINEIRAMLIKGSTTSSFKTPDGESRTMQGETEIAMQFPDKLMKIVKMGGHDGADAKLVDRKVEVVVVKKGDAPNAVIDGENAEFATADGKKVVVRRIEAPDGEKIGAGQILIRKAGEGDPAADEKMVDIEKVHAGPARQNELLRLALGLLLTAPEGMDVSYTFAGDSEVDGTPVSIVDAAFGGDTVKLYLSRISSLPVMISYQGHEMPKMFRIRTDAPKTGEGSNDVRVFTRLAEAPAKAEFQLRFSDYRSVNGVQLPYKWSTTIAGRQEEVFEVASYELNPANIAEKFSERRVFVRSKKAEQ